MTRQAGDGRIHVVGAGLAGLSAAVELAAAGRAVSLYEAGPQAGGRCRSYFDGELGCRLDNGNHLVLAGNQRTIGYLRRIGSLASFEGPAEAAFPFIDLGTGERWTLRPNRGPLPWWVFSPARRVPGTRARDYLAALGLRRAGAAATVGGVLGSDGPLSHRLWLPLAVSALNTAADAASARLFWRLLRDTLGRGGGACRPMVPREGLSESLVEPALAMLRAHGAEIRFGARLRALDISADRVVALGFDGDNIALGGADAAILAVPAPVAARLVPGLVVPDRYSPILNAHFRCAAGREAPFFIGIVGGTAEWVFKKRDILSVTVSAADRLVDLPAETLRDLLWRDVAAAYRLAAATPPARILKERRATFLASPEQLRRRPPTTTRWPNLLLAGDYTGTGLPATIEGAIRSGFVAAQNFLQSRCVVPAVVDRSGRPTAGNSMFGAKQQQHRGL